MRTNVILAALIMIGITLALFFVPLINGLIGGAVGGYLAGTWKRGLSAALLPAVVIAFGVWLLLMAFDAPVLGLFAGLGISALIVLADLGMLAGAIAGGYLAESRQHHAHS